jgi:tetratricopeptide (TPR) repeat protein
LDIRRELAASDQKNTGWQSGLAYELFDVGKTLLKLGQTVDAIKVHEEALAIREYLIKMDPKNVSWMSTNADSHEQLAEAFVANSRYDVALKECDAAMEIRRELGNLFPQDRIYQLKIEGAYECFGDTLRARGSFLKEQSDMRSALDSYKRGAQVILDYSSKHPKVNLEAIAARIKQKIKETEDELEVLLRRS